MALPTVTDLKNYLRIEHTAEDTLLTALLLRATAMCEQWTDTPITTVSRTAYDPTDAEPPAYPYATKPLTRLIIPWRPVGTVSITDAAGATVDPTTYRVDARSGIIVALNGAQFTNPPYAITAEVGFAFWDNYATMIEPLLSQVIIDLAADLYTRRTPMATSETGAGTTISWDASRACVERSRVTLASLKLPVGL